MQPPQARSRRPPRPSFQERTCSRRPAAAAATFVEEVFARTWVTSKIPEERILKYSLSPQSGDRNRSINFNDRPARCSRLRLQTRCDSTRHRVNALRPGRIRTEQCDRLPRITADADLRIDFDLAEQRHAVSVRDAPPLAMAEDVNPSLAMRATKETHVLDH